MNITLNTLDGLNTVFSLFSPQSRGLFISGPFEGGHWRGGGLMEGGLIERGAYLFIQKTSDEDYLFELQ